MASVNDYGDTAEDRLDQPPLGGPDGWAAAVAAALGNSDTPVDDRVTFYVDNRAPRSIANGTASAATLDSTSWQVMNTLTITPNAGTTTDLVVIGATELLGTAATGSAFEIAIGIDGVTAARTRMHGNGGYLNMSSFLCRPVVHNGNSYVVQVLGRRESGTGTAVTYADGNYNSMSGFAQAVA